MDPPGELFNEIHRSVTADWKRIECAGTEARHAERFYGVVRDFLKAAEKVWDAAWGNPGYFVTNSVTIKAMIRVCADVAAVDADPAEGRVRRCERRLSPWGELVRSFRADGFYERFPAKGRVERVARIHKELLRAAEIEPGGARRATEGHVRALSLAQPRVGHPGSDDITRYEQQGTEPARARG